MYRRITKAARDSFQNETQEPEMFPSSFAHLNHDFSEPAVAPVAVRKVRERSAPAAARRGGNGRRHQLHRLLRRKPVLAR
jgi:hypothetical protein